MLYESILKQTGDFGWYQWVVVAFAQFGTWSVCANSIFLVFGGHLPSLHCTEDCKRYFASVLIEFLRDTSELRVTRSKILTAQLCGVFLGTLIGGHLSDKRGRRTTLLYSYLLLVAINISTVFCTNWKSYALLRFLLGILLGIVSTAQTVLFTESVLPKYRELGYYGGWPVGFLCTGALAYFFRDWRSLTLAVTFLTALPLILLVFLIEESPKWLIENDRTAEALSAFRRISKRNQLRQSWKEFERTLTPADLGNHNHSTTSYAQPTYAELFRPKRLALRTACLLLSNCTISMINYSVVFGIGHLSSDPALNTMLMGVIRLPVGSLAAEADRRFRWFGRRLCLQIGLLVPVFCLAVMLILDSTTESSTIFYGIFAMVAISAATFVWMADGFYQQEIYPTHIRTMGNAACNCSAKIGNIFAAQMLPVMDVWRPFGNLVMCGLALSSSCISYLWLPETKGRPLPDEISDSED